MRARASSPKTSRPAVGDRGRVAEPAGGGHGAASQILHLQRTVGNQAVQRLVGGGSPAVGLQTKLKVGEPDDEYEKEADRTADQVMRMPEPSLQRKCDCGGSCPKCSGKKDEEEPLRPKRMNTGSPGGTAAPPIVHEALSASGQPLSPAVRASMEPRFGQDFSGVRVHTDPLAARSAQSIGARAYTARNHVVFGQSQYRPETPTGRRLLAHELTHVAQQERISGNRSQSKPTSIQRESAPPATEEEQLSGPLAEAEWQLVDLWRSRGEVGGDQLTDDPGHNALLVADALFCSRFLRSLRFNDRGEDPLLCVISEVTRADPRVQQLSQHVTARGPIINWAQTGRNQRMLHVMELLVDTYNYPVNGAAGLVGNLWAESGVLPSRIQGSNIQTPMTARDFAGQTTQFTAAEVMNLDPSARQGPRSPGIGLAQWTSPNRRAGLFQHTFQGRQQGAAILFNMDAQVDYLVSELRASYPHVNAVLSRAGVSLEEASDEVVYRFEAPRAVLDARRDLLPRENPVVQGVFARRRSHSQTALAAFRAVHPQ